MSGSIHGKLSRVRPPRVHITYEVETGGAEVKKELPFVVGVVGDLAGNNPSKELKPLRERKFVQIDRDTFDKVMASMAPGLNLRVENTLAGDGSEMAVQLQFNKMSDFEPVNIARQVEPLRKLLEARNKLQELATKVDASAKLDGVLQQVLTNTDELKKWAETLGKQSQGE
jgi:type VI secretion system protein ImpB